MKNDMTQHARALLPSDFQTENFAHPADAVVRLSAIYESNTAFLRDAFARSRIVAVAMDGADRYGTGTTVLQARNEPPK